MGSRTDRKNKQRLLYVRISFAVYVLLLITLCVNLFLIPDKTYIDYEAALTGLAYLFNVRLVLRNFQTGMTPEMSFYFLAHVIVAIGAVFLLLADKMSSNAVPSNFNPGE